MTAIGRTLLLIFAIVSPGGLAVAQNPADGFHEYILQAVDQVYLQYPHKGYDINRAFTHEIDYCGRKIKPIGRPPQPPKTMCVAAVAEVIVTALNLYMKQTGDKSPCSALPVDGWNRMRPKDIKSYIWVDPRLNSYGTADALVKFGIGRRVDFSELTKGAFINLNRNIPGKKPSGHAVVFLSYLDRNGNELPTYGPNVAGFKYFSAQGSGSEGGFGYRYGFFMSPGGTMVCPTLSGGRRRDCGITYSTSQKLLNAGYMFNPAHWDPARAIETLKDAVDTLYLDSLVGDFKTLSARSLDDFAMKVEEQDTMELNPIFETNATTDDDLP